MLFSKPALPLRQLSRFVLFHSSAGASRGFTLDVALENDEEMIVDFYKRHWGILQELRLRFLMLVQADYWQQFRDGYLGRDTVRLALRAVWFLFGALILIVSSVIGR